MATKKELRKQSKNFAKLRIQRLRFEDFKGGWLFGAFTPALFQCKQVEYALKRHKAGEFWPRHYQKKAWEYNHVISGELTINGEKFVEDDIFIVPPMAYTKPRFLTDCIVACFKTPSLPNDKELVSDNYIPRRWPRPKI